MSPPHLRSQPLVVSDFALSYKLVRLYPLDAIRVPQREDLPPVSFRFRLAADTLTFG
jgi:hypothetical protein